MNFMMTMEMNMDSGEGITDIYLRDQDGNIILDQDGNPIERVEQ